MLLLSLLCLFIFVVIWGVFFLFMCMVVNSLGFVVLIELRVGFVVIILFIFVLYLCKKLVFVIYKKYFFIIGVFNFVIFFLLFVYVV